MGTDVAAHKLKGLCETCRTSGFDIFIDTCNLPSDVLQNVHMEHLIRSGVDDCCLCKDFFALFNRFAKCSSGKVKDDPVLHITHQWPYSIDESRLSLMGIIDADEHSWSLFPLVASKGSALPKVPNHCPSHGNYVRGSSVDYNSINEWMKECRTNHQQCAPDKGWRLHAPGFRAIDCRTRELRAVSISDSYAALSYVCAQVPENQINADGRLPSPLPQLIEDAITVALNLGIPFLWVDRYCITQSNESERHLLIRSMDRIYAGADLTIIAAADTNSHDGLPGVPKDRCQLSTFSVGQREFVSMRNPAEEIKTSVWSTRGWTYQEMLLSRRRLVFTNTQIYFQCTCMCRLEGLNMEWYKERFPGRPTRLTEEYYAFPAHVHDESHSLYDQIVEYYDRQLSFDEDVLNALSGLFRAYMTKVVPHSNHQNTTDITNHFFGIPIVSKFDSQRGVTHSSLAAGLSWRIATDTPFLASSSNIQRKAKKRSGWPSWSWASFKYASLEFDKYAHEEFREYAQLKSRTTEIGPDHGKDISVTLTRRDGTVMDLASFGAHKADYADFEPWLDITTWTYEITTDNLTCAFREHLNELKQEGAGTNFVGLDLNCMHLDPVYQLEVHRNLVVVFLHGGKVGSGDLFDTECVTTLLAEEVEPGLFKRVGLLSTNPGVSLSESLATPPIVSRQLGAQEPWQKRTVRLI